MIETIALILALLAVIGVAPAYVLLYVSYQSVSAAKKMVDLDQAQMDQDIKDIVTTLGVYATDITTLKTRTSDDVRLAKLEQSISGILLRLK